MSKLEELRDIVSNGILENLFKAEEAIYVNTTISYWSYEINKSSFKRILANLQRTNSTEVILCVSKIYDWSDKHNLRSIPAALKLLDDHASKLEIINRHELSHILNSLQSGQSDLTRLSDTDLTKWMVNAVRKSLPRSDNQLSRVTENLKTARDKKVAHSEVISNEIIGTTTYEDIKKYLEPAKNFMRLVGMPYLETAYWLTDHYSFEADARRTKVSLENLLDQVGVIDKSL